MSDNNYTKQAWHVVKWPPLAWVETGLKAIAIVIGIITGIDAIRNGFFGSPFGPCLTQTVIMVVLSLGLLAAIFDRIAYRDIISMVFVIFNNLGHWSMVLSLFSFTWGRCCNNPQLVLFCGLMLLGDIVKLIFIATTDFTVRNTPRSVLFSLTGLYIVGYIVILIIEWVICDTYLLPHF